MAGGWSLEETKAFFSHVGQESVPNQLEWVNRNHNVYQRISMQLEEYGYEKWWQ